MGNLPPDERFEIIEPLGSGANGSVSLAFDKSLNRNVALKQLRVHKLRFHSPGALYVEARSWARVIHPQIVTVFDVLELDGKPTIVMELVEGETLRFALVERNWGLKERVECLRSINEALIALTDAGITHGDLRLENVLVSAQGDVKITDFGLSRSRDNGALIDLLSFRTMFEEIIPEQLRSSLCKSILVEINADTDPRDLADRLRLLHAESCNEPTVDKPDLGTGSGQRHLRAWALLAVTVMVLVLLFSRQEPQPAHVIVNAAEIDTLEVTSRELEQVTGLTVQIALEQSVLESGPLLLLESSEVAEDWPSMPSVYGDIALVKVTPVLNCEGLSCQIFLRYEGFNSEGDSISGVSDRVPFVGDGSRQIYDISRHLFFSLPFIEKALTPGDPPTQSALQEFSALYKRVKLASSDCEDSVNAIKLLQSRLPTFPPVFRLGIYCGLEIFYATGEAQFAEEQTRVLSLLLSDYPEYSKSLYGDLVRSYAERGDLELAEKYLQRAEEEGAAWWSLTKWRADLSFFRGDYSSAAKLYEQAAGSFPARNTLLGMAVNYYYWGELEAAKESVDFSLTLFPEDPRALSLAGLIHLSLGDLAQAKGLINKAMNYEQGVTQIVNLSLAHLLSGEAVAAERVLRSFQERQNGDALVLLNLADSLKLQGKREEADFYYEQVASLGGRELHMYEIASKAQALAHLERFTEAIALLRESRDKHGAASDLLYAEASVYALAGEAVSASAAIAEAREAGYRSVWFTFPWFSSLCSESSLEPRIASFVGCSTNEI